MCASFRIKSGGAADSQGSGMSQSRMHPTESPCSLSLFCPLLPSKVLFWLAPHQTPLLPSSPLEPAVSSQHSHLTFCPLPDTHRMPRRQEKAVPREAVVGEPRAGALLSCAGFVTHGLNMLLLSQPGEVTAQHTSIPGLQLLPAHLPGCLARGNQEILMTASQCVGDLPFSPFTHSAQIL